MSDLLQRTSAVPDLLRSFHLSAGGYADDVERHARQLAADHGTGQSTGLHAVGPHGTGMLGTGLPGMGMLAALVTRLTVLSLRLRDLGLLSLRTAQELLRADSGSVAFNRLRVATFATAHHRRGLLAIAADARSTILRFDPVDDGRIVEAFGDVQRAEHIAIIVPGMTNALDNYPTQLRAKALALYATMQARQGLSSVAVIAWLGYDTPDGSAKGLVDAAGSTFAQRGAAQLVDDLRVVRSLRPDAHLTVIGHSYGSVVVGRALRSGLPVDDAIAVGSPGMDAASVRALQTSATVWASAAPDRTVRVPIVTPSGEGPGRRTSVVGSFPAPVPRDPVRYAPVHGPDPTSPRFGALLLPAPDTQHHGDYFRLGSRTLANLAAVAVRSSGDAPMLPPLPGVFRGEKKKFA